jgi:hypothetical protein
MSNQRPLTNNTQAMDVIYAALQGYKDLAGMLHEMDDEHWDAVNLAMAYLQKELGQSENGQPAAD